MAIHENAQQTKQKKNTPMGETDRQITQLQFPQSNYISDDLQFAGKYLLTMFH